MDVMEKMSSENRLIDADALIHRLLNTKIVAANLFQYANAVTNMIGDAPTIEAEPVRHGYWGKQIANGFISGMQMGMEAKEDGNIK